jgi:hypothetical protein
MKVKSLELAGVAALLFAAPAFAHHSFAMFDQNKITTLNGTIKEFEWVNPHSWVNVTVQDPATNKTYTWALEAGGVQQLAAKGWKKESLKPGDKVAVDIHPLKDGSHGGQVLTVKFPDGHSLTQGRDAAQ